MARIIVSEFITLDGVVEDPGGAGTFEHGGWSYQSFNDEYFNYKHSELFAFGSLLLGRVTYEALLAARSGRTDATGFAARMDTIPKHVVSSSLTTLTWDNSVVIRPPVTSQVLGLKRSQPKDILVVGSRTLVQTLMNEDLVDEYRLLLHPIVLGSGHKLFDGANVRNLKLTGMRQFSTGVVVLTYVPDRSKVVMMHPDNGNTGQASSSR